MKIAMAAVSMSAAQARDNGYLGLADRIVMNRDNLVGEAKKEVLKMVDDGYVPPLKKKTQSDWQRRSGHGSGGTVQHA